jgi:hypothetical protein
LAADLLVGTDQTLATFGSRVGYVVQFASSMSVTPGEVRLRHERLERQGDR